MSAAAILAFLLCAAAAHPVLSADKAPEKQSDKIAAEDMCVLPEPLCGDKPKFGKYWNDLNETQRKIMLQGFDVGLSAAWQTSYLEGEEAGSIRGGIFDRRLNIGETYAGVGIEEYVDYFNKLYADSANETIDWSYAWMLASLSLQSLDSDTADRNELHLKKFLQTYGELPGWVRIVGVKDVNLIEVEVLVPEPYHLNVKLRGVANKFADGTEMTAEQKSRATSFIKGLGATRGYPFENCGCTEMVRPQLFYGSNLFTSDGTLEAYVRISESSFCLIKDEIQARELVAIKPDSGIVLNETLLAGGLSPIDEESSDYIESDKMMQAVDNARRKGLNIYGKSRIAAVEKIIKQGAKPVNQNCLP